MSKLEFMRELEVLLQDIPLEEKQEALQYYAGYFDDAGPDREQSIISELGSPAKVAASIKADINSSAQEAQNRGFFTEKGFEDDSFQEPKYEIQKGSTIKENANSEDVNKQIGDKLDNNTNNNQQAYSNNYNNYNANGNRSGNTGEEHRNKKSGPNILLIVLLCIFGIPVGIPLIATAFALIISVVALLFSAFIVVASICFTFIVVSFVFVVVGICLAIVGLVKFITLPVIGICFAGVGLLLFGIGLLFSFGSVWLCKKALPATFRFCIDICRLPFNRRRAMA